MCYEFWHSERMSADEKAKQKAAEIDKARSAKPVSEQDAPLGAEQELEQETAPA